MKTIGHHGALVGAQLVAAIRQTGKVSDRALVRGDWSVRCRQLRPDVRRDVLRARVDPAFALDFARDIRRATGRSMQSIVTVPASGMPVVDVDALQRLLASSDEFSVEGWLEAWQNIVVNQGLDDLLSITLAAGTQDTSWFVGLKGSGSVAAGDTLASHAGWSELTPYAGNRLAWTPGAVSAQSVSNSASTADFAINGSATVHGAFLAGVNTGTSGRLYAAGDFSGGSRAVISGDTLKVTATFTTADDGV